MYDALVFFTYRYAPTVLGLRIAPARSILVPTAHDEPAIRLEIYKEVFSLPAGVAYNTASERRFLARSFSIPALAEDTIGCGVDLPQHHAYPRTSRQRPRRRPAATRRAAEGAAALPGGSGRTSPRAARCSAAATACTGRSPSTAAASRREKGARSWSSTSAPTRARGATRRSS